MASALAFWLLLDATTLEHNAQVSPVGTRRTVGMDLLGPIAETSRILQVSRIESTADGILGRNGNVVGHGHLEVLGPRPQRAGAAKPGAQVTGTTSTTPSQSSSPSAKDPLKVLILGDSLGIDLGDSLQNQLAGTGVVMASLDAKESTGLTRPDYFNWPSELASDLSASHPAVVVAMFGTNDPQDFPGPPDIPFDSPAWIQLYEQTTLKFMQEATATGARLIWVSIPPMQDPGLNARINVVNDLQRQAALQVRDVVYLSSASVLGDAQGGYTAFILANGKNLNVRTPDGVHLSPDGSALLASAVVQSMRSQLGIALP
jgi:hypothetical protein